MECPYGPWDWVRGSSALHKNESNPQNDTAYAKVPATFKYCDMVGVLTDLSIVKDDRRDRLDKFCNI
jgi:hypothetical protein